MATIRSDVGPFISTGHMSGNRRRSRPSDAAIVKATNSRIKIIPLAGPPANMHFAGHPLSLPQAANGT
jgi:hypothetical protein